MHLLTKTEMQNIPFEIEIKRKPNWGIVCLSGAWILGFSIIFITAIYGSVSDQRFDHKLFLFLMVFALIAVFLTKTFFWHIRGKEKITLSNQELIIEQKGTFLTIPKKFATHQIDFFAKATKTNIPRILVAYGVSGGYIEFQYLGQKKYFGQTLSKKEAEQLVLRLNHTLQGFGHNHG